MSGYTIAWLAWLGAFGVIEAVALWRKGPDDTLSEHVWKWFGTARPAGTALPDGWTRLRRFALLSGVVWLGAHFITGGWV